jgi:hypothetical protein
MFPARSGITFAATIEQPKCPAKLQIGTEEVYCELIHGHRQKRHQFSAFLYDDLMQTVEIYWTKKPLSRSKKEQAA